MASMEVILFFLSQQEHAWCIILNILKMEKLCYYRKEIIHKMIEGLFEGRGSLE
jgi:hypothetical protein